MWMAGMRKLDRLKKPDLAKVDCSGVYQVLLRMLRLSYDLICNKGTAIAKNIAASIAYWWFFTRLDEKHCAC
jgi:hypothetical protein